MNRVPAITGFLMLITGIVGAIFTTGRLNHDFATLAGAGGLILFLGGVFYVMSE